MKFMFLSRFCLKAEEDEESRTKCRSLEVQGCALDKQSLRNMLVNRETVIYMLVKNTPVKRQLGSKGSYIVICTLH